MGLEESSSEDYSDSRPSHSHPCTGVSVLELSAFNSRPLGTESVATGTVVNNSTPHPDITGEGHDARLASYQLTGDSSGSVDDCVNSFEMEQDRGSSEQIPIDLPQLPLSMYSVELYDLNPSEDGAAKEGNHSVISEGQCSPDQLRTHNSSGNEVSQSLVLTRSDPYPPTVPIELLSFSGINSITERRVFPTEDINEDKEAFMGVNELQPEYISAQGEMTAVGRSIGADLRLSPGENDISKADQDFPISGNDTSQTTKSISDNHYAAFSFMHDNTDSEGHRDITTYEHGKSTTGPNGSIISKIEENHEHLHEFERFGQECRVDIASLPVMKNPLQKAGRHTVIRGKLPESHPFSIAADNLGYKLVSRENNGRAGSKEETERRKHFMHDLKSFLKEIGNRHFKIPVIGGGDLDIYFLTREVMLLGGVHNVVRKRAFRIVAQQLRIPKTCTSAASVLKGAYERLLFHYEQRLVFGKWPANPAKPVNMKERVCQEKMKERRTRSTLQTRAKRKSDKSARNQQLQTNMDVSPLAGTRNMAILDTQVQGTPNGAELVALVTEEASECPFELPTWAQHIPNEQGYEALIEAAQRIDATNGKNNCCILQYPVQAVPQVKKKAPLREDCQKLALLE